MLFGNAGTSCNTQKVHLHVLPAECLIVPLLVRRKDELDDTLDWDLGELDSIPVSDTSILIVSPASSISELDKLFSV